MEKLIIYTFTLTKSNLPSSYRSSLSEVKPVSFQINEQQEENLTENLHTERYRLVSGDKEETIPTVVIPSLHGMFGNAGNFGGRKRYGSLRIWLRLSQ
jgi:hypothetical protein